MKMPSLDEGRHEFENLSGSQGFLDFLGDLASGGHGIWRLSNWPTDNQIIGAGSNGFGRRRGSFLIVRWGVRGADTWSNDEKILTTSFTDSGDFLRRGNHTIEPSF